MMHPVTTQYLADKIKEYETGAPTYYLPGPRLAVGVGKFLLIKGALRDQIGMVCGGRYNVTGGLSVEVNWWERIEAGNTPIPQLSERIEYPAELVHTLECSWLNAETVRVKDVAFVFLPRAIEKTQAGVCVGMNNAFI